MEKEKIHSTAIIDKDAEIADDVEIGPYCIIGPEVKIDSGCVIGPSVVIEKWTQIGKNNKIQGFSAIGTPPQDIKYKGYKCYLTIGDNNIIREFVTIHRGAGEGETTIVGNNNMLMAYVHIAHNCKIGNEIIIANSCGLSGHVMVEDRASIGGFVGVHQFVRIGNLTMVGGYSKIGKDVPPYSLVDGRPAKIYGINSIGMKRRGIQEDVRTKIRKCLEILTNPIYNLKQVIEKIEEEYTSINEVEHLIEFLKNPSRQGIMTKKIEDSENAVTF